MTTRADEIAERAAFLARTFGEQLGADCFTGAGTFRLSDRAGRLVIGCDSLGTVSIILDGRPAFFRYHGTFGPYSVHVHPDCEDELCKLLGVPHEVAI